MNAQIELLKTPNADLPAQILKPTVKVLKHAPSHVDYIEAGHKYPIRYYRTGPFAGTSIEQSPAVLQRNSEALEKIEA